mgnify:CR=1 FL=1
MGGVINGRTIYIYLDADVVMLSTNVSFSVEQKLKNTSVRNSNGWNTSIPDVREWSMECEGALAFNNLDGSIVFGKRISDIIQDNIINRNKLTAKITTQGSPAGSVAWIGEAYITSVNIDTPNEDSSTYSFSLSGINDFYTGLNGTNF